MRGCGLAFKPVRTRTSAASLVTDSSRTATLLKMLRCLRRGVSSPDRRRRKRFHGDSCTTVRRTLRCLELLSHCICWQWLLSACILARYNLNSFTFNDSSSFRMCTRTYGGTCRLLITALIVVLRVVSAKTAVTTNTGYTVHPRVDLVDIHYECGARLVYH